MMTGPQKDALVNLAFSLVPGLKAVIAGGFAADWTQAKDLDLWVLSDPLLERTGEVFTRHGVKFRTAADGESSIPTEDVTRTVAICQTPVMDIHVIGVSEASTADLLDTFDISTHRWAITRDRMLINGIGATTPYETGRVLLYRFPASTDKRVARLKDRYDIEILPYVDPKTPKKTAA